MAIYIEFERIKGNVTSGPFKDMVAVDSVDLGVSRPINMTVGQMSNRESGKPSLSEISISKQTDKSICELFKAAVGGSAAQSATIKFVRTGTSENEIFMEYILTDCLISSYSVSASGDDTPRESFTLSYSSCVISYNEYDAMNKSAKPQRTGYDLTTAKPI